MQGIYKITNKINNKVYIGQSIHIEVRIKQHFKNAFNKNTHTYDYPLYRSIRKYGVDSFKWEVLEETTLSELTFKEQKYIDLYKATDVNFGYNMLDAEDAKRGEACNWAILTDTQFWEIIDLIQNTNTLFSVIGEQYGVSGSCIEDINKGRRRTQENLTYPLRKDARSIAHQGERQNTAILTEQDVFIIRHRYVDEKLDDIYEDYKDKISYSGFKKIIYGATWKHQPCYKKHEKRWVYPCNSHNL